jgi:hypothetical protein
VQEPCLQIEYTTTLEVGSFDTNYIIFRNIEIFTQKKNQMTKICERKHWTFKNILFVKMKNALIIQQTCVEVAKVLQ